MLTYERLREILEYNPQTGVLTWRIAVGRGPRRRHPGDTAGTPNGDGALRITFGDGKYLAHRLAWFYVTGAWPNLGCDHRDLDRSNNRWDNLREATQSQNGGNTRARRTNKSGYKGVSWSKKERKWQASITVNYYQRRLGVFDNPADAHLAYMNAATKAFGEFARST